MPDESQGAPLERGAILALAGSELDAEIAERLMGFGRRKFVGRKECFYALMPPSHEDYEHTVTASMAATPYADFDRFVPHYSTDRNAAHDVLEEVERRIRTGDGNIETRFLEAVHALVGSSDCTWECYPMMPFLLAPPDVLCRVALLSVTPGAGEGG